MKTWFFHDESNDVLWSILDDDFSNMSDDGALELENVALPREFVMELKRWISFTTKQKSTANCAFLFICINEADYSS